MDILKISNGKGENLFGFVIPEKAVFGKIGKIYYVCDDFKPVNIAGSFNIRVYNDTLKKFRYAYSDKFPKIHEAIMKHVINSSPEELQVAPCELKTRRKHADFYRKKSEERKKKRAEIDKEIEYYSIAHEATKMRKPPIPNQRAWNQSCVDGTTLLEFYSSAPCAYSDKYSGNIHTSDIEYMHDTKSFRRDSVKHPFAKYHTEDNRPIIKGKREKDRTPEEWASAKSVEDLRYWILNLADNDPKYRACVGELYLRGISVLKTKYGVQFVSSK